MPIAKKHQMRRITAAVCGTPWALEENVLSQIVELLQLRRDGFEFTEDEVRSRISVARVVEQSDGNSEDSPQVIDGVAVLPLFGVLAPRMTWMMDISGGTSTQVFASWFDQALRNSDVKAIVLNIDSPGGSAQGNEEVAQIIRAARGQKPIKAVATGMMASAAYYIGSAADEIIASPSTEVGSIGTYTIHGESSRANENQGYKYTVVKAGANKAVGNSVEPLTADSRGVIQERIDALNSQFVAAVAANRKVSVETVQQNFGQGKVMLAPQAKAAGLIDRVGTLNQVVAELRAAHPSPAKKTNVFQTVHPLFAKESQMLKVKAAFAQMGLLSAEASDEVLQSVCRTFFLARGSSVPKDEDAILAALAQIATPPQAQAIIAQAVAPLVKPDDKPLSAEEKKQIAAAERARIQDLEARGKLLGMDDATIRAAIDDGMSIEKALVQWTEKKAATHTPVSTATNIVAGTQEEDKIFVGAVEAFSRRGGCKPNPQLDQQAKPFMNKSLLQMAELCLKATNRRAVGDDPDAIACAALRGMGEVIHIRADNGGYARPADFPNLLANIMGKEMDLAMEEAETTYQFWAAKIDDVPNFMPKTLIATGEFSELPRHPDGKPFEGSNVSEEASWIAVDSYGDEWALTPKMIVDGQLDVMIEAAKNKQYAHEATQNRLCVNLLTGNVTLPDTYALFDDTNHGNDLATGLAPTTAQLAAMRLKLRKQKGVSALRAVNLYLAGLLVPPDIETTTQQLLAPSVAVVPTAATGGEVFRGSVEYWVDPMLGDNSATIYYGFAKKTQARPIVWCRQTGFGQMKSKLYFDEKTNNRILQVEGRMAAAVRNWRGVVRNAGTGGS